MQVWAAVVEYWVHTFGFVSDDKMRGGKAVGGVCVRACGRGKHEGLVGADVNGGPFIGEKRKVERAVVVGVVGIVRVVAVVSVGGFGQGVCVRKRGSDGRRLDTDVGGPLEGEKEVGGAIVRCAVGLVHVGTFGVVVMFSLKTDRDLNTEEFLVEVCFVRGEVRGKDI